MPASYVRLSAGREAMNEQVQALCFFAGANSIFYGEKLLTTPLPEESADLALFARLGLQPERTHSSAPASEWGPASKQTFAPAGDLRFYAAM